MPIPEVKIIKNTLPIVYLDTNALIELSRYEKRYCTNEHVDKIGELDLKFSALSEKAPKKMLWR